MSIFRYPTYMGTQCSRTFDFSNQIFGPTFQLNETPNITVILPVSITDFLHFAVSPIPSNMSLFGNVLQITNEETVYQTIFLDDFRF